ncbi:MAG: methyltransferase domain-containing protein [Candidatus Omnitrophota bacterium]
MCTIGYHKKLNLVFKNRDKTAEVNETVIIKPEFLAIRTEGADYHSLGVNKFNCAFVSAAVNTPEWTALVSSGKKEEAFEQFKKENKGLVSPMLLVSKYLPKARSVDEWMEMVLNSGSNFMGYNVILADREKVVHIELHRKNSKITPLKGNAVIANHFKKLRHGPVAPKDYPSSFKRLDFASGRIKDAVSIEDIFQMLKVQCEDPESSLWRKGVFSTVSSSVIDVETCALYYSCDQRHNYARITRSIPLKGSEKVFIEMSRYIDLPTYHNIERGHPFYVEMIEEIEAQIKQHFAKKSDSEKVATLELGAGTGLCSLELIKHPFLKLDALEIDNECCKILASHPEASKYNVVLGDAVTHCKKNHYDLVVSTFAHDHIHYNNRFTFVRNIYNNLKKGGLYIMGGELLPYFSNDDERKRALFKYHNYIIELALGHNRIQLAELENNALKSGLDMVGDFKRHEAMFEQEMESAGFTCLLKKKMGPLDKHDVGGVFVYVFKA